MGIKNALNNHDTNASAAVALVLSTTISVALAAPISRTVPNRRVKTARAFAHATQRPSKANELLCMVSYNFTRCSASEGALPGSLKPDVPQLAPALNPIARNISGTRSVPASFGSDQQLSTHIFIMPIPQSSHTFTQSRLVYLNGYCARHTKSGEDLSIRWMYSGRSLEEIFKLPIRTCLNVHAYPITSGNKRNIIGREPVLHLRMENPVVRTASGLRGTASL